MNLYLNQREKFEPGPRFELRTPCSQAWRNTTTISQVAESQARDLEVRDSNPGPGSNFSLEFKL